MSNPNNEYKIVLTSVAPIYSNPSFSSELINQALYWEELIVEDLKDNWFKIKQRDGYIGWVHSFYVDNSQVYDKNELLKKLDNWYFVKDRFSVISLNEDTKLFLSFGSLIPCLNEKNEFLSILPNGKKYKINKNSIVRTTKDITIDDVINYAKSLLGTSYLWGGRSSFGFDCSGLIQSLLSFMKIHFPRDSKDQIKYKDMIKIKASFIKGDIIFFSENSIIKHVGIFINQHEYLHSSGYVKINSINHHHNNFDKKLFNLKISVYRLNQNE